MIEIVVSAEMLKIIIPEEMKAEARHHLGNIWRDEFAGRSNLAVELTKPIKAFIENVKLSRNPILIYW
ncbi:MAG: hypothetical protein KJ077_37155 [Anaerolineae bacterium]|nr:hypothetical protein [Anaerolineae bacterium]